MGALGWLLNLGFAASEAAVFLITVPPAEGIAGRMVHVKEVAGSPNTITIQAENGVHTVAQTIERLTEIKIASADGGVLLLADGVSNWEIVAHVKPRATRLDTTITSDTTLTLASDVILVDASGGPVTVTLLPSALMAGATVDIKKVDSSGNTVTVDANASETIDDGLTAVLTVKDETITLFSDGSGLRIL